MVLVEVIERGVTGLDEPLQESPGISHPRTKFLLADDGVSCTNGIVCQARSKSEEIA